MMNDDLTHLYSLASVYKSDTMLTCAWLHKGFSIINIFVINYNHVSLT